MEAYRNLSGDSGISEFEIGSDFIKVRFRKGGTYTYTYRSAGQNTIEQMKSLAVRGSGLNTFIDRYVKKNYASKSRH
jgi:hypothetical protein